MDAILDLLPARIYRKDLEGRFAYANRACLREMAVKDLADLLGKTDYDFFESAVADEWRRQERTLVSVGGTLAEQIEEERWLGRESTWAQTSKMIETDELGQSTSILGISYDITQHYREKLLYQLAGAGHRDGVWRYDAKKQQLWMSPQCPQILDDDQQLLLSLTVKQWIERIHPDDRERINTLYRHIRPGSSSGELDCRIRRASGDYVPVRFRLTAEFNIDGMPFLLSGSISDRSDFAAQEANYRLLLDLVPGFIFVKDHLLRFEFVNRAIAIGFGLPAEALRGKTDADLNNNQQQVAKFRRDDTEVLLTGKTQVIDEESFDHRISGLRVLQTIKVPRLNAYGVPDGIVGVSTDITAFAETRRYLRALMDHVPDGVFFKNLKHEFTHINAAMAAYLGLAEQESCQGKTDFDFFPAESAGCWKREEAEIFRTGKARVGDVRPTQLRGVVQWRKVSKIPVRDPDGLVIGLVGITHDLTQERHVQDSLREQSQLLEAVLDAIPFQVSLQDRDGRYLLCNKAFAGFIGLHSVDDVRDKTDDMLNRDLETASRMAIWFARACDGTRIISQPLTDRDLNLQPFECTVSLLPLFSSDDHKRVESILTIRDSRIQILQRQERRARAQLDLLERLRREDDFHRRIYLLLLSITRGDSLGFNRAICWRRDDRSVGSAALANEWTFAYVTAIGQSSRDEANQFRERALDLEVLPLAQCLDDFDKRRTTPDEVLDAALREQPLRIEPQEILGRLIVEAEQAAEVSLIVGLSSTELGEVWDSMVTLDATEVLLAIVPVDKHETLVIACDNLYSQESITGLRGVDSHSASVAEAQAFLQSARPVLAKARMLSEERQKASTEEAWRNVAHDVSHRLENIRPFTLDALGRIDEQGALPEQCEDLKAVRSDLVRALDLIIEFKRYASPIELPDSARSWHQVEQLLRRIERRGERFSLALAVDESAAKHWLFVASHLLIDDCFTQLAQNSVLHNGSMREPLHCILSVKLISSADRVSLGLWRGGDWISFRFTDNGRGIPHDRKQKIFEPAYSTHPKGTGLGLSIAKRVVEAHGGRIEEVGVAGKGAEFRILMPSKQTCPDNHTSKE